MQNVLYSVYSIPPSEADVTMHGEVDSASQYTALPSETNVTMAEGFRPCHALKKLESNHLGTEYTAKSGPCKHQRSTPRYRISSVFDGAVYVERLQKELGIPDNKMIGLEGSDGSIAKIVDSNECLMHLEQFQPIPVDFSQIPEPVSFKKTLQPTSKHSEKVPLTMSYSDKSVESYLLRSATSVHHEI